MVVHPDGSVAALAPAGPGALLGVRPDNERVDHVVTLDRGSTVPLCTDGLVESRARTQRDGLVALRGALERRGRDHLDALADTLVTELPAGPGADDVAYRRCCHRHRVPARAAFRQYTFCCTVTPWRR
jgi:hypothetical protein